jgi:2-polyprenyl-6-methoxyphenol hydroxylase-like FAD-dependent oxidoreductase
MNMNGNPHVLIIGGGIGGLCLANGLHQSGVSVAVYERTRSGADWQQPGYRIHVSPHGARALHACLSPRQWDDFVATAGSPSAGFTFLDEKLHDLLFFPRTMVTGTEPNPVTSHHSVSRIMLRRVLLSSLNGVVHMGKEFTRYEQTPDGQITAFFADGTSATGDVLVGADGTNSLVRKQYLPEAHRADLGIFAIAGKLPLTDENRAWLPERLYSNVNNIMPPRDSFMFTAVWEGDRQLLAGSDSSEPDSLPDTTQDYLFWVYAARQSAYRTRPGGDGAALRDTALSMISRWHPALRRLVGETDPATIGLVVIRAMEPVEPWPASRITLLGDAIHNMTPMAGIGANTALQDASLLREKLAGPGPESLVTAIGEYEAAMRDYGFAAVRLSVRNARQATAPWTRRVALRTMLRATNAVPLLKRRFARSLRRARPADRAPVPVPVQPAGDRR